MLVLLVSSGLERQLCTLRSKERTKLPLENYCGVELMKQSKDRKVNIIILPCTYHKFIVYLCPLATGSALDMAKTMQTNKILSAFESWKEEKEKEESAQRAAKIEKQTSARTLIRKKKETLSKLRKDDISEEKSDEPNGQKSPKSGGTPQRSVSSLSWL